MTMTVKEALPPTRLFIGGDWCEASGGESFETLNPATEEVISPVSSGTIEDVDRAVRAARKAFNSGPWPHMPARERGRVGRRHRRHPPHRQPAGRAGER
ncbi:MAG: aldehyde dehydrogenase family protein, partial [Acidobacteriota bacterium]